MNCAVNQKMLIICCIALLFTAGRCTDDRSFVTKNVRVGEDVTLTCSRRTNRSGFLFWIRVAPGNLPEVLGATYTFDHGTVNKTPHISTRQEPGTFALHIRETELNDTAFYFCKEIIELQTSLWNITFLRVRGPEPHIPTVIQEFLSDPIHPGDSVTLQCSVLSDSQKKTCTENVYWFRAGVDETHPSVIYVYGSSGDECKRQPDAHSPQTCVYNFSKNSVRSSDSGTYYCAVATCGHIIFGNGAKLNIEDNLSFGDPQVVNTVVFLLFVAVALSLMVIALLSYIIKKNKYNCLNAAAAVQTNAAITTDNQQSQQITKDSRLYTAVIFTVMKMVMMSKRDMQEQCND